MLSAPPDIERPEPRWPVIIAVLAAVGLHFALPDSLRFGPSWLVAGSVLVLIAAAHVTRNTGHHQWNSRVAYAILGILTGALLFGVAQLVSGVLDRSIGAPILLRSACILWLTNVIVFASWYWRLDAGGPNARERADFHDEGAFLFPQMTFTVGDDPQKSLAEEQGWRPNFVDYLFVSFNTSTAFSPTDAPVLTRWAKSAMMIQALISFTTVVLIAARAVNILPS